MDPPFQGGAFFYHGGAFFFVRGALFLFQGALFGPLKKHSKIQGGLSPPDKKMRSKTLRRNRGKRSIVSYKMAMISSLSLKLSASLRIHLARSIMTSIFSSCPFFSVFLQLHTNFKDVHNPFSPYRDWVLPRTPSRS